MNRRTCAVAAAVAATLVTAAACDTSPGAAALVGGHRFSASSLQSQVRAFEAQSDGKLPAPPATVARELLTQLIQLRIISSEAAVHHIVISDQTISQTLQDDVQEAGGLKALQQSALQQGVPAGLIRQELLAGAQENKLGDVLLATQPVSQAQLEQAYQQNLAKYETAHVAHILVSSKSLAEHLLGEVKSHPARFGALAARYSTDTGSKSKGGDLGFVGKGQTVAPFDKAIFADPIGSYVLVHSQYGYHVIHIIARRTTTLAQAAPELKDQLLASRRSALLQQDFVSTAKRVGVHVNPRYGSWDPVHQSVAAVNLKHPFVAN